MPWQPSVDGENGCRKCCAQSLLRLPDGKMEGTQMRTYTVYCDSGSLLFADVCVRERKEGVDSFDSRLAVVVLLCV